MKTPRSIDDLSFWFLFRYAFWLELITRTRSVPFIKQWAIHGMGDLLRPLPVRLQDELLGEGENQ